MIIQELCRYYERLLSTYDDIPEYGMSCQNINYAIVINAQGELIVPYIRELQNTEGKKTIPMSINVPKIGGKRTSGIKPYFMWDKSDYVLGFTVDKEGNFVECKKHLEAAKRFHNKLLKQTDGLKANAVLQFYEKWDTEKCRQLNNWKEIGGKNFVFQIENEHSFIHQDTTVAAKWKEYVSSVSTDSQYRAGCLITGEIGNIPFLHPSITGIRDAHTAGAGIVAINKDKTAFCSYNKTQGHNAPICELAAFKYTTTLNYLLKRDSRQKLQIGDATTVFWTERESEVEGMLGLILDPKDTEVPDNANIKQFLEAVRNGKQLPGIDPDVKFYILGLSPNGPRLSVRFWHACTVGQLEQRIGQHFKDLQMVKSFENDPEFLGIWRLLQETINKKSKDKSPQPLLAGAVMRSILEGTVYPQGLQAAVINRIRADQDINYIRAAVLKAILNRKNRIYKNSMEVSMALDKENKNTAYLLGRLFAVLEKAQQDALGQNINATIKDRFFGSASATPAAVFPQLLRLAQHHVEKAEYGKSRDKQIEEIICDITDFPAHLSLDQQGLFAIGYYHQRQSFYQKKDKE